MAAWNSIRKKIVRMKGTDSNFRNLYRLFDLVVYILFHSLSLLLTYEAGKIKEVMNKFEN